MQRRLTMVLALASTLITADALADVTGWAHVGGGALGWQGGGSGTPTGDSISVAPMMAIDMGVGTDHSAPFIFGGFFRVQPLLTEGVDLALLGRFATHGFQSEWFGFALDAGGYARFWDPSSGGFIGQAVLGGPLGLQLAAIGTVGGNDSFGFGGVLGIDFARLTVFREHLLDWWPNPQPQSIGSAAPLISF